MTPFFAGSEPVTATSGKYAGISILQDEQNRGLDTLLALDSAQRDKAILNPHKTANYNLTEAFKDNVVLDYAGARAAGFWISSICTSATWTKGMRASSPCPTIYAVFHAR